MIDGVDENESVGFWNSLCLDHLDNPSVCYYDSKNHDLKYAKHMSSGWNICVVDAPGDVGKFASMALDTSGPHISYYDETKGDLKHAWMIQQR